MRNPNMTQVRARRQARAQAVQDKRNRADWNAWVRGLLAWLRR